ncbi:MAG: adenosine deaminase [Planctomycetota bacterium]|nr:MAG: adenosine deaminase [Planctomycetota bacterium]
MTPLICTLGLSWQIIPEAYALLAPHRCPLYARQPGICEALRPWALPEPDALWIVSTDAATETTVAAEDAIRAWWQNLGEPVPLRFIRAAAADASAQAAIERLREVIFRSVLAAGPQAVLCLSGGRKTMSADMQQAGHIFGCAGMFHVMPPESESKRAAITIRERLDQHDWSTPLPADLPIQAAFIARYAAQHLVGFPPAITATHYPISSDIPFHAPGPEGWLWQDIARREEQASSLLVQAHEDLARQESMANWRGLYRLSPQRIKSLRQQIISASDRDLLQRLPKAELHCHIGGILDLSAQIRVGKAIWDALPRSRREVAQTVANSLDWSDPWTACSTLKNAPDRSAAVACCLAAPESCPQLWSERLYAPTEPRLGLKGMPGESPGHARGFDAYELPGELSGSALLGEPLALLPYAQAIRDTAVAQGLRYLELRGSPTKYRPHYPLSWLLDFYHALQHIIRPTDPLIRFMVIGDWRTGESASQVIGTAVAAKQHPQLHDFIVGIDLAGDESKADHNEFSIHLEQAFAACLPITIHAGEGTPAQSIWQATYRLHADRIGHGLTLADHPDLARRFRDRRICVELCPTSNREVVGFADPDYPGSHRPYPLATLLDMGVPCTLCTDNPGISRTTLADEYIAASRMSTRGLSWWNALGLIRQGFSHAFCSADERDRLLVDADRLICELITQQQP